MSDPRGRFVWFDLMTSDPEAAKKFYMELIGWTITPFQIEGMDNAYDMWTAHEEPLGGVMLLPEEAQKNGTPPHWLGYIATPDVDATVTQASGLGANVYVPAQSIPSVGRFAVLADPAGAVFAVYTSEGEASSPDGPPKDGQVSWVELMTVNYEETFEFYAKCFGWKKSEAMDMGEQGTYQMFGRDGDEMPMGGVMEKPPEVPVANWMFYFQASDIDAQVEQTKSLGGQILHGPVEVPGGGRIVVCMDPQGAAFALFGPPKG